MGREQGSAISPEEGVSLLWTAAVGAVSVLSGQGGNASDVSDLLLDAALAAIMGSDSGRPVSSGA